MGSSRKPCPPRGHLSRAARLLPAKPGEKTTSDFRGATISCADLPSILAPKHSVYRVSLGLDVFREPEWEWTGDNRFDDPEHGKGNSVPGLFRVIYCASSRTGAFGETIARFRKSLRLLSRLGEIEDDEPLDPELEGGLLPEEWLLNRRVGASRLDESLNFADLDDPPTATLLRRELAPLLGELGLDDLDFSDLIGRERQVTQNAARCIYQATEETGAPVFDGIRYVSRLNPGWELWAVFADRMVHEPEELYHTISREDPDPRTAAEIMDIEIE